MNRNTQSHFATLPDVEIHRSTFDRSHSHKTTGNVGAIIPVYVDPDIMPGDTVTMDTSKLVRFQTMLSPFMDNLYMDFYWFFVAHRTVWDHWINFMGENSDSAWIPQTEYSIPKIKVLGANSSGYPGNNYVGSILDYLGFPVTNNSYDIEINALPVRAYAKICEDWFRSTNLTDPINIYTGDATVTASVGSSYIDDVPAGGAPFIAGKYPDYFTAGLPSPQKGDAVSIAGQANLPVYALKDVVPGLVSNDHIGMVFTSFGNGSDPSATDFGFISSVSDIASGTSSNNVFMSAGNTLANAISSAGNATNHSMVPVNLWADTTQFGINVNDLRYAFQLQKLLERDARGGSRYIEIIKSHFGVTSPDARLQRAEYLGGNRFPIVVNQVQNQAQTDSDFLGDLGAYSMTTDTHSDFTHSFVEHGTLMCVAVCRYDHVYAQGLDKFWLRDSRFDYYWPVFANIGEQPVMQSEIYCDGGSVNTSTVFSYQEAWADYRYKPNRVSGEMRPYVDNNLGSWTLADDYSSAPTLSDEWFREDKTNVDRVLAVTSNVSNQFWMDIYFNARYTRPMPVYSIPGLIDHH